LNLASSSNHIDYRGFGGCRQNNTSCQEGGELTRLGSGIRHKAESSCYDQNMQKRIQNDDCKPSKADLDRRIDDWMERLGQLRGLVDQWIGERPDSDLITQDAPAVPMRESLMQQYNIPERSMPAFKVTKGDKQIALFRPVGLWVVGANGRVDVFTEKAAPILVDAASPFDKPAWKLYASKSPRNAIEFEKESFYSILGLA
jgi:hypothetical protein